MKGNQGSSRSWIQHGFSTDSARHLSRSSPGALLNTTTIGNCMKFCREMAIATVLVFWKKNWLNSACKLDLPHYWWTGARLWRLLSQWPRFITRPTKQSHFQLRLGPINESMLPCSFEQTWKIHQQNPLKILIDHEGSWKRSWKRSW